MGTLGIGGAVFLNAVVLTSLAAILFFSGTLSGQWKNVDFRWWFFIPGALGLGLVVGLPLAISRWGAMHTFLWVVATQIVLSAAWDLMAEGQDLSQRRILGGAIALVGAWIATR